MPGGDAGCWDAFYAILALEYSDPAYAAANLFTVDAHALQHAEDHGVKNNAFHLVRLCWLVEYGGDARLGAGPRWLQRHFDGDVDLPPLPSPAPGQRGALTVADLGADASPELHVAQARAWALAVWQAWQAHQDWARGWMERHGRLT